MFLTTEAGRRWLEAFAAAPDLDLEMKLTGIAHAAYANEKGEVAESDETLALAGALYVVCGIDDGEE